MQQIVKTEDIRRLEALFNWAVLNNAPPALLYNQEELETPKKDGIKFDEDLAWVNHDEFQSVSDKIKVEGISLKDMSEGSKVVANNATAANSALGKVLGGV